MIRAIFEGKEYIAQFIDGDVLLYDIESGEYVRNVVNPRDCMLHKPKPI